MSQKTQAQILKELGFGEVELNDQRVILADDTGCYFYLLAGDNNAYITYACDEYGAVWVKLGRHDLSGSDFIENQAAGRRMQVMYESKHKPTKPPNKSQQH